MARQLCKSLAKIQNQPQREEAAGGISYRKIHEEGNPESLPGFCAVSEFLAELQSGVSGCFQVVGCYQGKVTRF